MSKEERKENTDAFLPELKAILGEENVITDAPLSQYTTFRVGGPSTILFPHSKEELKKALAFLSLHSIPVFFLGRGSNLLVSDKGYDGVFLSLKEMPVTFRIEENRITIGGGKLLSELAYEAMKNSLTGAEFASGIPGTVGGGVYMNAGAYQSSLSDILESAVLLFPNGEEKRFRNEDLNFSYRSSVLQRNGALLLEATFALLPGVKEDIEEKMNALQKQRREKQPLEFPSAGSVFKRPEGYFAGKLIEDAGLKGYCIGDAVVSEKHAGFIVNLGHATAEDVRHVILDVQKKVEEQSGVLLEPEIRFLGEFACPLRQK